MRGLMKCKIEILPTAWEDLKAIEDYYAVKFDVKTAIKVSNKILDAIERLENYPDSGSATQDTWLNEMGYRIVIIEKYIVIFRHIEDTVFIYHIGNTQTEYTRLFF